MWHLEETSRLSENFSNGRLLPCNCSPLCCPSRRWCHCWSSQEEEEEGRFGGDDRGERVCFSPRFCQIASLSGSFSSHFPSLPLVGNTSVLDCVFLFPKAATPFSDPFPPSCLQGVTPPSWPLKALSPLTGKDIFLSPWLISTCSGVIKNNSTSKFQLSRPSDLYTPGSVVLSLYLGCFFLNVCSVLPSANDPTVESVIIDEHDWPCTDSRQPESPLNPFKRSSFVGFTSEKREGGGGLVSLRWRTQNSCLALRPWLQHPCHPLVGYFIQIFLHFNPFFCSFFCFVSAIE